ncbi:hypothetical protein [Actinoplanes regularis]|uniref:Uncharacterized protein n=1 Tax=Actinoplanes regularis TaxID=52697 RepID=A0A238X5B9_9ACTN|nr:hypothetical protein [Actinoplanes regularis]GIE86459.1 hypothetical protein Are01nite_29390 [Actinoplanes regularis]SNR54097.1 hypothetical protein SAMN06264365_10385 [Actinoplanes regularis]
MAESETGRPEPMARLVREGSVSSSIGHLQQVFSGITDRLRMTPIEQVATRLRAWDNYQRASLGRGETPALVAGAIKSSFSLSETKFQPRGEAGLELPDSTEVPAFAYLDGIVRLAAQLAIPEEFDEQRLVVTLFLYRVIARAGQVYEGFLHRDIASEQEPVGSVIFYPTVRTQNIEGAEFGAHFSDLPTEELLGRDHDVTFTPEEYEGAALVLGYPHNLAHGVRLGKNPHAALTDPTRARADDVRDLIDPRETTFVKDMAVLTFTKAPAIEVDMEPIRATP